MRNKFITLLIASTAFLTINAQTIEEKYKEGYELRAATINTAAVENNISFYRNNQMILLKPDPKGKNNRPVAFTATVKENGDIGKPSISKELSELGLSGTVAYDSIDGKLYFSRYNSLEKNYALYESTVEGGKWLAPKKMLIEGTGGVRDDNPFMVNAGWSYKPIGLTGFKNPCIAMKGKRIYFSANIRGREFGNQGSSDIYFIDKKDSLSWTKPKNIGSKANTRSKDDYPFCDGDSVLFFSTYGRNRQELVKSILRNGEWSAPENLGSKFNTEFDEYNLIANNKNVFLVSNRHPQGRDDIHLFIKEPPKPYVPNPIAVIPPPEPDPIFVKKLEWNFVLFYFNFDKYVLTEEFTRQFKELVAEMKQFPNETFELAGHTDQKGSDKYNDKLSNQRANFVKKLLVKEGFPANKLITKGFGEKMPVIDDPKTDDDYAQNRRVEVTILMKAETQTPKPIEAQKEAVQPEESK